MALLVRDPTGAGYSQVEQELQDRILTIYGDKENDQQLFRFEIVTNNPVMSNIVDILCKPEVQLRILFWSKMHVLQENARDSELLCVTSCVNQMASHVEGF